jgi:hypothetical protein
MGIASEMVHDYFRRMGQPGDMSLDAYYQYEMALLRDMLTRLEVILADEDVPLDAAARVIRCMLYGAPTRAGAEQRMRRDAEMVKLLNSHTISIVPR